MEYERPGGSPGTYTAPTRARTTGTSRPIRRRLLRHLQLATAAPPLAGQSPLAHPAQHYLDKL